MTSRRKSQIAAKRNKVIGLWVAMTLVAVPLTLVSGALLGAIAFNGF